MDFRIVNPFSTLSKLPSPEQGMRVVVEHAPKAEALAASWIERIRPFTVRVYALRRRIATAAVALLAGWLFVHVMFGANGMVVYRQKRFEYRELNQKIQQVERDNDRYSQQIQGLKSDETAIEKEAREQLGYAKPGEYVYVPPPPAKTVTPANHSAKK